jgi:hypothetical protein
MNNGRVNLSMRESAAPGAGTGDYNTAFSYRTTVGSTEAEDAIRGNVQATPLNRAYFSPANVQIVQNKIRREVYDRSAGEFLIDEQSVDELMIVMRAMYLQYGQNRPDGIAEQIATLNQIVADWCVPKILAECSMHKTYLRDIQNLPVPMEHPVLLTRAGSKSATFDRFF